MGDRSGDTLILSLAHLLSDKQVDANAITSALELFCKGFSFDAGMVYEIDQNDHLCLKERYNNQRIAMPTTIPIHQVPVTYHGKALEGYHYLEKESSNTPDQQRVLQWFDASSMLAVPILERDMRMYGMILLVNIKCRGPILLTEQDTLMVLFSMLVRYVGVRMYQNKLTSAKTALESVLDNTGIDIYVNDFENHDILYVNRSMAKPYGGIKSFVGKKCWEVLFPGQNGPCEFCPQKKLIDEEGNPTKVYTWDYERASDHSWFRVFSAAFRWTDGRLAHVVSSADITDNKRNEALIQYMANYDSLTNLPNRRMLVSECERRISVQAERELGFLLFFDIDGFKAINDNFGHDAGDEFLIQLGNFFSGITLLKDSVYRNGGDEFVAMLSVSVSKTEVEHLVNFIHSRFEQPWVLKGQPVFCNVSVGIACYPQDGKTAEELLSKADQAMYRVKKAGGGGLCFAD